MTSLTKVALGFSAAGTTTAGALYMGGIFKGKGEKPVKTSISKLLKEFNPKKRLIEPSAKTNDTVWKSAWKSYRAKNKDSKVGEDTWNLREWTDRAKGTEINEEEAPTYFVQACSSHGEQQVEGVNDDLYKEVLEFCTRDASVKDWILDSGKKILGDGDNEGWKATWKLYREENKEVVKGNDAWHLKDWDPKTSTDENVPEEFKKKCTEKLDLKSSDNNFESEYSRALDWCTKQNS
ncbi:hypothetical protein MHC_01450 [Mycoplasma haemocanis str. Illinois]|uniref:Uncharacterized protein n=1 Tax=Mycoplasma haemocanis (strain Illinois) TaxID=1111676 RepID=H6N684_MYCHN|nr:hypothetical protein [Mycoplasma haemocanis]AEW45156.1 hypothetical protein MHC_01450 [Mycoplasma haemocanis str. Illinois]